MQKQSSVGALQKNVLKDFTKFTRKFLCQSLFLSKAAAEAKDKTPPVAASDVSTLLID